MSVKQQVVPAVSRWSDSKLDKECAFADACRDDGEAERAWAQLLDAEASRRSADARTAQDEWRA